MNAEELKSKITFTQKNISVHTTSVTGEIRITATMFCDGDYVRKEDAINEVKERIRLMILKSIYDDQRMELGKAIEKFFLAEPSDYSSMSKAADEILKAAKYQKP